MQTDRHCMFFLYSDPVCVYRQHMHVGVRKLERGLKEGKELKGRGRPVTGKEKWELQRKEGDQRVGAKAPGVEWKRLNKANENAIMTLFTFALILKPDSENVLAETLTRNVFRCELIMRKTCAMSISFVPQISKDHAREVGTKGLTALCTNRRPRGPHRHVGTGHANRLNRCQKVSVSQATLMGKKGLL